MGCFGPENGVTTLLWIHLKNFLHQERIFHLKKFNTIKGPKMCMKLRLMAFLKKYLVRVNGAF